MQRLIKILVLVLCFGWILPLEAQDEPTPYEIALERIEEARVNEAVELRIWSLGLTELPPELWQLSNLQELYLVDNLLSSLPAEIGNLSNLQLLWIDTNQLSNLPAAIGNLSNLTRLVVKNNQLRSLPSELWQLSNLQGLYLQNNQLSSLPVEIGNLANLQELSLYGNQLTNIPPEIGQLINLCFLDLSENNFRHLPNVLGNLTHLADKDCWLAFDGNPLMSPPPEVIAEGTPAVLAYLRSPTWWHLQRLVISVVWGAGFLAIIFLGLRWRNRRYYGKKKKQM